MNVQHAQLNLLMMSFLIKGMHLLTIKPMLYVANVDEDEIANTEENDYVKAVREFAKTDNAEVIVVCAKIEEEMAELDDEDKEMFLEELGIKESGSRSVD